MSQPALEKANDTSGDKSIISRSVAVSSAALANSEITFLQYIKILTYGVVLLSAAGAAYYGLYFSHAYGATSEQIDLIKTAQELLSEHSNIIKAQVTDLGKEVGGITQLTDNQLKSTM
eukprot:554297_1